MLYLGGCAAIASKPVFQQKHTSRRVPILLYHHVQDLPSNANSLLRRWSLSIKQFEDQITWIANQGFHTITMQHLVDELKQGNALPSNAIVLTFDDAWREHYDVVFPILKKHNFVATFFITTGSVGHSAFVNWQQLQEMSAAGMDIQPHSVTHPHLDRLPYQEAFQEILDSKKAIEANLNKPATVFAYPFGGYNAQVLEMVKRAGFEGATTVSGLNHAYVGGQALYTLVRFAIAGDDTNKDLARESFLSKRRKNL